MDTTDIIQQSPYVNLGDAEAADALNALTVQKTDSSLWTLAGLQGRFGLQKVQGWMNALNGAGFTSVEAALAGRGYNFTLPTLRGELDLLASGGVLPAQDVADMKGVGLWFVSPWADFGNSGTVSSGDITAARQSLASGVGAISRRVNAFNVVKAQLDGGAQMTDEQWLVAISGAL